MIEGCHPDPEFETKETSEEEIESSPIHEYFQKISVLGQGSFGKVFLAYCSTLKKNVALKIIKKNKYSTEKLNQLRYEEHILSQLHHPNIIQFYQSKETGKRIYMALELAEGRNLGKVLESVKLTPILRHKIMRKLLLAVKYIHEKMIVHRDIKPDNIIVNLQDDDKLISLKLADFGLSFQMGNYLIKESVGTPIYFSPEILMKKQYSHLTDIWSCGIVFYMLFSAGRHPFYVPSLSAEDYSARVLRFECTLPQSMDSKAEDLFRKLCCMNPEERLSALNALNHPWMTGKEEIHRNPLDNLRIFNNMEKTLELIKAIMFLHYVRKKAKNLKPDPLRAFILKKKCSTDNNNAFASLNSSMSRQESTPRLQAKSSLQDSSASFGGFNRSQQSDMKAMPATQTPSNLRFKIQRKSTGTCECSVKPLASSKSNLDLKISKKFFSSGNEMGGDLENSGPNQIPLFRDQLGKQNSRGSVKIRHSESEHGEVIINRNNSMSPVYKNSSLPKGQRCSLKIQLSNSEDSTILPNITRIVNGNFTNLGKISASQIMRKRNSEAESEDKLPSIHKASKFKNPKK